MKIWLCVIHKSARSWLLTKKKIRWNLESQGYGSPTGPIRYVFFSFSVCWMAVRIQFFKFSGLRPCVWCHLSFTPLCKSETVCSELLCVLCSVSTLFCVHCVLCALCSVSTVFCKHCVLCPLCSVSTVFCVHCVLCPLCSAGAVSCVQAPLHMH